MSGSKDYTGDTVYATSPRSFAGFTRRGVVMAIWDSKGVSRYSDTKQRNVAHAAVSTLRNTYSPKSTTGNPGNLLADAVELSISNARYDSPYWKPDKNGSSDNIIVPNRDTAFDLTAIALTVAQNKLHVAYTGQNRAYLLRKGQLIQITEEPPTKGTARHTLELQQGDRVLMCTEAVRERLYESQLAHILMREARPADAVNAILEVAARSFSKGNQSVGVLYCEPRLTSPQRMLLVMVGVFVSVLLSAMIWTSGVIRGPTASAQQPTALAPTAAPAMANAPTALPTLIAIMPTTTHTPEPSPTLTPSPTATSTPRPTTSPTQTPAPISTATSVPTNTPVARTAVKSTYPCTRNYLNASNLCILQPYPVKSGTTAVAVWRIVNFSYGEFDAGDGRGYVGPIRAEQQWAINNVTSARVVRLRWKDRAGAWHSDYMTIRVTP